MHWRRGRRKVDVGEERTAGSDVKEEDAKEGDNNEGAVAVEVVNKTDGDSGIDVGSGFERAAIGAVRSTFTIDVPLLFV